MNLQTAAAREYTAAKRYWVVIVALQFVLLACSVTSVWAVTRPMALAIGIAMVLAPVLSLVLKQLAGKRYGQGERLRRHYVLEDALGRRPGTVEVLMAAADSTCTSSTGPQVIGRYYDSNQAIGYARLAEITEESAFYTRKLAAVTAILVTVLALLGVGISVGVLWWTVQSPSTAVGPGERAARLFTQLFGFFAAGFFAEMALSFKALARAAEAVFKSCDPLRRSGAPDPIDVFVQVDNYDSALAKSLPLPSTIKRLWAPKLANAWTEYRS
jgi:hypothetical protein